MKSITIHKLEDDLERAIMQRAKRNRTSLNKTIKSLLRSSLGLSQETPTDHKKDFDDLFGSWTKEEAEAFNQSIKELDQFNQADWQR